MSHENKVYVAPAGSSQLYSYDLNKKNWIKVKPVSPYRNPGLVVVDGRLMTVGGLNNEFLVTKEVLTLQYASVLRSSQWKKELPELKVARHSPAVVWVNNFIIVVGGFLGPSDYCSTVELLHKKDKTWSFFSDLPSPLYHPSATICGVTLYIVSGHCNEAYSCSLYNLFAADDDFTVDNLVISPQWKSLTVEPFGLSTVTTLNNKLILVGGGSKDSPKATIAELIDGKWVKIGSLSKSRCLCLAVSPSPDKVVVIGDFSQSASLTDCVEVISLANVE